jgi:hypothetical protein
MTTEKDDFYDKDTAELMENVTMEEVFTDEEVEQTPDVEEPETKEEWQLSKEEDELLKDLLERRKREDVIMKTFLTLEQKPDQEQIDNWKKAYGDVYLISLSEKMNFVFRPLKRQEWRQLMAQAGKLSEIQQTEMIVQKAVVWPRLQAKDVQTLTGGAPEALRDVILEASHFMPPERAMVLVRQL